MPRQANINEDKIRRIAAQIAAGNDQETAAQANGISRSTHYAWLQRGKKEKARLEESSKAKPRKGEEIYLEYLDAIEQAIAEAEVSLILNIRKAANEPKTWQAAAWILTHGPFRDRWKQIQKTELSGPDGKPIQSENKNIPLTEVEVIALADEILGLRTQEDNTNKVDSEKDNK